MEDVGAVIFLLSLIAFLIAVLGLINPAWARLPNRWASVKVWLVSVVLLITGAYLTNDGETTPTSSASNVAERYLLQAEQKVEAGDLGGARTAIERLQALQQAHGLEPTPKALELMKRVESVKEPSALAAGQSRREPAPSPQPSPPPVHLGTAPEPTCPEGGKLDPCWEQLASHPGCYVWYGGYEGDTTFLDDWTVTWSSGCADGLARGSGTLKWWEQNGNYHAGQTGLLSGGKKRGHWVLREKGWGVEEGPYVDGKKNGHWVEHSKSDKSGSFAEGPYVDDRKHGYWVYHSWQGGIWQEGPYVNGKKNGHWVDHYEGGHVFEGPYVDDKKNGHWVERYKDGNVENGPYVDGKKHGRWVIQMRGGGMITTTYVNGRIQPQ